MVESHADREIKRLQELLYTAWHIEAFARQKKLPRLETVLKPRYRRKPEPGKSGLWHALVGGSIVPDIVNGVLGWFSNLLSA